MTFDSTFSNQKTNERKEEATEKSSLNNGAAKDQAKKTGIGFFVKAGVSLLAVVGAGLGGHAVRNATSRLGNANVPSAQLLKEDSAFTAANVNIFASKVEDDPVLVDNGGDSYCWRQEDDPFCGGGYNGDVWTELSCTPYTYKPNTYNLDNGFTDGTCGCAPTCENSDYLNNLSYGGDDSPDANVWAADPSTWWLPPGSGTDQDYFVFHGCDGAGLQSDCLGDIRYGEHIIGRAQVDEHGVDDGNLYKGEAVAEGICGDPNNTGRNYCKFVHPGTMTVHQDYYGGFMQSRYDCGNMGDENALCIVRDDCKSSATTKWGGNLCDQIMNIPYNYFDGRHPFAETEGYHFSFTMYSWRCENDGPTGNNLFSYPSISDWGWKCFVDNEPGDDSAPPQVEIYFGVVPNNGSGNEMWLHSFISYDTGDGQNFGLNWPTQYSTYTLYNVNKSS